MDGRGRALDNVFVERLWRSVKYEEVYLKDYADGWQAENSLARYFRFYCHQRVHQSLGYRTPEDAYHKGGSRNGAGGTKRRPTAQKNATSNGTQHVTPLQRPRKTFEGVLRVASRSTLPLIQGPPAPKGWGPPQTSNATQSFGKDFCGGPIAVSSAWTFVN